MQRASESNPFDTTGLIALPLLNAENNSKWDGFNFDGDLGCTTFHLPDVRKQELPVLQLSTFQFPSEEAELESLDATSSSAYDTAEDAPDETGPDARSSVDYEDVWILPDVKDAPCTTKLNSWDHFHNEEHKEPAIQYVSEAGAQVFDAILAQEPGNNDQLKVAPADAHLDALFELALGRCSQYMRWDERHQEFVPIETRLTVSGHSPELIDDLRHSIGAMGRTMRLLSNSEQRFGKATPSHIAFWSAAKSITTGVQSYIERQRGQVESPVQLQDLLEGPRLLVGFIDQLSEVVKSVADEVELLSGLSQAAQSPTMALPRFRILFDMVLSAVAGPVLMKLRGELCHPSSAGNEPEPSFDRSSLVPNELSKLIREIRTSKYLLSVVDRGLFASEMPSVLEHVKLGLKFTWADLAVIQDEIDYAETRLRRNAGPQAVNDASQSGDVSHELATMEFQNIAFDEVTAFPPQAHPTISEAVVAQCLISDGRVPIMHLIPYEQAVELSLAPLITAQHRMASFKVLALLFKDRTLSKNLHLLQQFQLLGDGAFATRISLALFDSEQSSGEGGRLEGGTVGLRLYSRESWPPASFELRLALMGILKDHLPGHGLQHLEETVSFSLRELPEELLERCRDVNSIYALDFLRMHYRPPNALLEAVLTPQILDKYDRIFHYLLRLLRVQHVAQILFRQVSCRAAARVSNAEHRLRIQIQHVISTIADYSHNTVLSHHWLVFEKVLATIQSMVDADDYEGTLQSGRSFAYLRDLLEEILDSMLKALLLKEKQSKARKVIEDLFGEVLAFAASQRSAAEQKRDANDRMAHTTLRRQHDDFTDCVSRLRDSLQKEDGLLQHLLLRLEM